MDESNKHENDFQEFHEEEDEFGRVRDDYSKLTIEAATKGDIDLMKLCIEKRCNINFEDKKKWTPIIWASCKGNLEVVRLLIDHGAHNIYIKQNNDGSSFKVVMGAINPTARVNPLQWACFKGHPKIVSILLRCGIDFRECDSFGNNSIHLAASSGNTETFRNLLMWGVTIDAKNSRGHLPLDLSTNPEINSLIEKHNSTKNCFKCNTLFGDEGIKHYCHICKNYFCKSCHNIEWMINSFDTDIKEILDVFSFYLGSMPELLEPI